MISEAEHQSHRGWQQCPPGEIDRLVSRLQSQRRRRTLRQAAVAATALSLLLIVGAFAVPRLFRLGEPNYGGLTCSEVRAQAEGYLAGTLDQQTRENIQLHLSMCPSCRQYLQDLQSGADHSQVALRNGGTVSKVNQPLSADAKTADARARSSAKYERCED